MPVLDSVLGVSARVGGWTDETERAQDGASKLLPLGYCL